MGVAGRQKLVEECAAPVVARQTAAVYRAAISGSRLRSHPAPVPSKVGRS